ncbi:MAG: putative Peptidase M48 [Streblomastix strix]|uniref:Putative Peptidase M48 n=1 Tax=Streblomastix strix TaxID=222440 RepID=A0A5J4WVT2_9EUKA|nr:MAG: putative Peptidase M48 [Streblomastix strix]
MLFFPLLAILLLVGRFLIGLFINIRQIRHHQRSDVPNIVKYVMTDNDFKQMNAYAIDNAKFAIVKDLSDLALTLIIILGKVYPKVWLLTGRIALKILGTSQFWQTSLFLSVCIIFDTICAIPLHYYKIFVIEQKFGFNKQTKRMFISDNISSLLIKPIILVVIINIIFIVLEKRFGGEYYWVFGFAIFTIFIVLFNIIMTFSVGKIIPLEQIDQEMYQAVKQVCNKCDFDTKHIIVSEGSKRSAHSNAQIMDIFGIRKVILFDTLVELAGVDCSVKFKELQNKKKDETKPLLNIEQTEQNNQNDKNKEEETNIAIPKLLDNNNIIAAISHEIGHQKYNLLLLFYLFSLLHKSDLFAQIFGFIGDNGERIEYRQSVFDLLGILSVVIPIISLLNCVRNTLQRHMELQADQYSARQGYGQDLGSILVKIFQENLKDLNPDPIYSFFYDDHPILQDRMNALGWIGDESLVEKRIETRRLIKEYNEKKEKLKEEENKKLIEQQKEKKK